jgi:hypothetical protein
MYNLAAIDQLAMGHQIQVMGGHRPKCMVSQQRTQDMPHSNVAFSTIGSLHDFVEQK